MPVYEYQCRLCSARFELFVRDAGRQVVPSCPRCGSVEVHKVLSVFKVGGASKSTPEAASCRST